MDGGQFPSREKLNISDNIDQFLEQFLSACNNHDLHRQINLFSGIPHFMRTLPPAIWEAKLFSPVISKGSEMMNGLLNSIESNHMDLRGEDKEKVSHCIQAAICMMNSLVCCSDVISQPQSLACSLPLSLLQILHKACILLEVCSSLNRNNCDHLNYDIQILTEMIENFNETVMCQLDSLIIDPLSESDLELLCCIVTEITNIVSYVHCRDQVIMVLWRSYAKLLLQYDAHLSGCVNVGDAIKPVCQRINHKLQQIKDNFHSSIIFCSETTKILVVICGKCTGFDHASRDIFETVLRLYEISITDHSKWIPSSEQLEEILTGLTIDIKPLVYNMLCIPSFQLLVQNSNEDLSPELNIAFCLLKTLSLKLYPAQEGELTCCFHSLFATNTLYSLFGTLCSCQKELMFAVELTGDPNLGRERPVPFYTLMLVDLCSVLSSTCRLHFSMLEKCLLNFLVCGNNVVASLVCDIWCFLARYGPPLCCYNHCCMLANLFEVVCDTSAKLWISFILHRLFNFLSPLHKDLFMKNFWHLPVYSQNSVTAAITSFVVSSHETEPKLFMKNQTASFNRELKTVHDLMISGMLSVDVKRFLRFRLCVCVLSACTIFLDDITRVTNAEKLLMVLHFANTVWDIKHENVQLSALTLLNSLYKLNISYVPMRSKKHILHQFTSLFLKALSHKSTLLHFEALRVLVQLSLHTPHEAIIKSFVRSISGLRDEMKSYLKDEEKHVLSNRKIAGLLLKHYKSTSEPKASAAADRAIYCVTDVYSMEEEEQLMQNLEELFTASEKIQSFLHIPEWAKVKIQSCCKRLTDFTSSF